MAKDKKYYAGDLLTKIGCGIFGGAGVALYYNFFISGERLWPPFFLSLIVGSILAVIGYFLVMKHDK